MSFINKINIYIVDRNYLIHRGIKQNFLYSNLFYYIDSGIKYLYFFENLKLFKIENVKIVKYNNKKKKLIIQIIYHWKIKKKIIIIK